MKKKFSACLFFVFMFVSAAAAEMNLWSNYISTARLTSAGRSDYPKAKFLYLYLEIEDNTVSATKEHVNIEGSMTISGGKYSVVDNNNNILQSVSDEPMTFKLVSNMKVKNSLCYVPKIGEKRIYFVPEDGKGLNGLKVKWDFSAMTELNGDATLADFKTTSEQLADAVPFIDLNIEKNKIPSFKFRFVKANNISKFVSPEFTTAYATVFRYSDNEDVWTERGHYPGRYGLKQRYTWQIPQELNGLKRVDCRIFTQDANSNSCVYQWNFQFLSPSSKEKNKNKVNKK